MDGKKMNDNNPRFDWKTFWATTIVTLALSSPSWVPVFGVSYEDFGAALVAFIIGFFPVFAIIVGMLIGWYARNRKAKEEVRILKEQYEMSERAEDQNPHGFSKRALNAWKLMEERDKRSLGRLAGASILNGETPILPLVLDMDGSLVNIGLDTSMVKSLERLGLLERYPERALMPIKETDEKSPIMQGVDALRGEAIFATSEGIYMTRGCTAQFCVPGDFASPPMQCVDLGLYCYTDIGQEILRHVNAVRSPKLFCYLDEAYQKRREAGRPFHRWETEI